jgi:tetratricopeptide (TPR) repeat protein
MNNKIKIRKILWFLFLICTALLPAAVTSIRGQDRIKDSLFMELEAVLEKCRKEEVPLFAPSSFSKAMELYHQAQNNYSKGERVSAIQEKTETALEILKQALKSAKISKAALEEVCSIRKDASRREYIKLVPNAFAKAERSFQEAVSLSESGDIKNALNKADEAIEYYREATVLALEKGLLKETEKKLSQSKKKLSQKEYKDRMNRMRDLKNWARDSLDEKTGIGGFIAKVEYTASRIIAVPGAPITETIFIPDKPKIKEFSLTPDLWLMREMGNIAFKWQIEPGFGGSPIRSASITRTHGEGPAVNYSSSLAAGEYSFNISSFVPEGRSIYTLTALNENGLKAAKTVVFDVKSMSLVRRDVFLVDLETDPEEIGEGVPFTFILRLDNRSGLSIPDVDIPIKGSDLSVWQPSEISELSIEPAPPLDDAGFSDTSQTSETTERDVHSSFNKIDIPLIDVPHVEHPQIHVPPRFVIAPGINEYRIECNGVPSGMANYYLFEIIPKYKGWSILGIFVRLEFVDENLYRIRVFERRYD